MNVSNVANYNPVSASYGSSSVGGVAGRFYTNVYLPPGVKMDPVFCVDLKPLQKVLNLDQAQVDSGIPVCGLVKGTVNKPIFYYPIAVSVYNKLPGTITLEILCSSLLLFFTQAPFFETASLLLFTPSHSFLTSCSPLSLNCVLFLSSHGSICQIRSLRVSGQP